MKKEAKTKKILFVMQSLRIGGAERELVTLANKLTENGYDVTIILWMARFDFRDSLDKRVRLIYKAPDKHLGNYIPYIRHKYYDDWMWSERASLKQLYRYYVGREKYDVEIAFFHSRSLDIVAGSTNKKALHLAWIHNDIHLFDNTGTKQWRKSKEKIIKIGSIVCVSDEISKEYDREFGHICSITTIRNLLPVEQIIQQSKEEPKYHVKKARLHLVLVARFDDQNKGQLRLINAVGKLRACGCDISLSLVGEGSDKELIQNTVREKALDDAVTVIEGQTNPYPYIKEADLLVCASYTEGYNLTVAEALILGTPVLSTACAGPSEILDNGKYGMIVENSGSGLFHGIKKLYDDPKLLEEYRQKTVERMDFFDEEKIFKQITDLFDQEIDQ